MNFEIAKDIVQQTLAFDEKVNLIFGRVKQIDDETLRKEFMAHVERLVEHSSALIIKIVRIYPQLNPDS